MEPQPYITLVGPDKRGLISRLDHASGVRHPVLAVQINANSKPQVQLARILPNNSQQPLGTASYSSLSGSVRLAIHGQPEVKMEQSWEGMQYAKVFQVPVELGGNGGKLRWKPAGWGEANELWDDQGIRLAKFKSLSLGKDPQLDVYIMKLIATIPLLDALAPAAHGFNVHVKAGDDLVYVGDLNVFHDTWEAIYSAWGNKEAVTIAPQLIETQNKACHWNAHIDHHVTLTIEGRWDDVAGNHHEYRDAMIKAAWETSSG
ncbi:hypothetical protein HJFPF1_02341 [Paramyrothecium foliicola]|nr:hypothetical protein HJFPF1_02341 [Paramyrothecium foliicola]